MPHLGTVAHHPAGFFAHIALGPVDDRSPDWFGMFLSAIVIGCAAYIVAGIVL